MQTVAACVVVVCVWALIGSAMVGVGRVVRAAVSGPPVAWRVGDFWIGVTVTLGALYAAHLVAPITPLLWLVLGPVALFGLLRWSRRPRIPGREQVAEAGVAGLLALYVANRALQVLGAYDSYLYGLQTVRWIHTYKAVPGLANLHSRLGYNSASAMFDAFIGSTVSASYAHHFANSLFLMVLLIEVLLAIRLLARRSGGESIAPALLLLLSAPALIAPMFRALYITSLTPDLPALVVTLAAAYYTARIMVTVDEPSEEWLVGLCLLVLMPMIRIQLGVVSVVICIALALAIAGHRVVLPRRRHVLPGSLAIAGAIVSAFVAHGIVLSGYPAFPAPLIRAPVAWAVPKGRAAHEIDVIRAWARSGSTPDSGVLQGMGWASGWARRQAESASLVSVALVGVTAIIFLLAAFGVRIARAQGVVPPKSLRGLPGAAALVVCAGLLLPALAGRKERSLTYFVAVGGALALVIAGMAVRAFRQSASNDHIALSALAVASLIFVGAWAASAPAPPFGFGPLCVLVCAPATAAVLAIRREAGRMAAICACVAVVAAGAGFQLYKLGVYGITPVVADGSGWLGLSPPAPTESRVVTLPDGSQVRAPVATDKCGDEPLPCTPFVDGSWRYVDAAHPERGFEPTR